MNAPLPDSSNCIPFSPLEIHALLRDAPFAWWVAGGWALDLFLGRQTRPHFDIDVAVARADQPLLQSYLNTMEFWAIRRNETDQLILKVWDAGSILGPEFPGVWVREAAHSPWRFEFLFQEMDPPLWIFRHWDAVRHPLDEITAVDPQGIPYLHPEIVLLTKAMRLRPVDEQDFQTILPGLGKSKRARLAADIQLFNRSHPWLADLA